VIDLFDVLFQAVFAQLETVCTECIRDDKLCACLDIFAMDVCNSGGIGDVEFIEAFVESHTARVEHGAHRAIGEKCFVFQ
jgi:hypothetical protein